MKIPGFVCLPPSGFSVGHVAESVQNGIDVRANTQTEMVEIIPGIDRNNEVSGLTGLSSDRRRVLRRRRLLRVRVSYRLT